MNGSPSNYQKSRDEALKKIKERKISPPNKYPERDLADLIGRILGVLGGIGIILIIQVIFGL
jgi:hypothetical protein